MGQSSRFAITAAILAVGMVLSSAVISKFFVRVRHEKTISVKGYAEANLKSDIGKLRLYCQTKEVSLQAGHQALGVVTDRVLSYLREKGFAESNLTASSISSSEIRKRTLQGYESNETEYFQLSRTVGVQSGDVELVRRVALEISELIGEGLDIGVGSPEFFISDLEKAKIALLAAATADGHARAGTLAENSGGSVGPLVSARQGVFQITEPHSTYTADYGVYDTSTIDKVVKAVVTLEYAVL